MDSLFSFSLKLYRFLRAGSTATFNRSRDTFYPKVTTGLLRPRKYGAVLICVVVVPLLLSTGLALRGLPFNLGSHSASDAALSPTSTSAVPCGAAENLPARALAPLDQSLRGCVHVDRQRFVDLLKIFSPQTNDDLSLLLHAIHLFGPNGGSNDNEHTARMVEAILDSRRWGTGFRQSMPVVPTRYGVRFPRYEPWYLSKDQRGTQAHHGQALSVLAEVGTPLEKHIHLPGGKLATVHEAVTDLAVNLDLSGELYWDAIALALYLPPHCTWDTKFRTSHSLDEVALALLRRPAWDSSCAGVHRLHALTVLARIDREIAILRDDTRTAIWAHLRQVSELLARLQDSNGFWEPSWFEALPGGKAHADRVSLSERGRLVATGHHLEWLLLMPKDARPPSECIRFAAIWLFSVLSERVTDTDWLAANYCPATHAMRALLFLTDYTSPDSKE